MSVAPPDEQLVAALYEEYGAAVYSYALRLTRDRGQAEDVLQEVLLRAWRTPPATVAADGTSYDSSRGWLFTVTRNVVTDMWRAQRARPREVSGESVLPHLPDGDDEIARRIETWAVEAAMEQLTPDHRAVLSEVFLRGRSVAEAAAVLGVPPGTVKSRTYHALRNLRSVLDRHERGLA